RYGVVGDRHADIIQAIFGVGMAAGDGKIAWTGLGHEAEAVVAVAPMDQGRIGGARLQTRVAAVGDRPRARRVAFDGTEGRASRAIQPAFGDLSLLGALPICRYGVVGDRHADIIQAIFGVSMAAGDGKIAWTGLRHEAQAVVAVAPMDQ